MKDRIIVEKFNNLITDRLTPEKAHKLYNEIKQAVYNKQITPSSKYAKEIELISGVLAGIWNNHLDGVYTATNTNNQLAQYFDYWFAANKKKYVNSPENLFDKITLEFFNKEQVYPINIEKFRERFGINQLIYGRYVNFLERINFFLISYYYLDKLEKITDLKPLGLGILNIGYGASGIPNTSGYFSFDDVYINLNRRVISDVDGLLRYAFIGVNSIVHEYGHFLDFVLGQFGSEKFDDKQIHKLEKRSSAIMPFFASLGKTTICKPLVPDNMKIRKIVEDIVTNFCRLLEIYTYENEHRLGDYYYYRTEIFARSLDMFFHLTFKNDILLKKLVKYHKIFSSDSYKYGFIPVDMFMSEIYDKFVYLFETIKKQQLWQQILNQTKNS